MADPPGTVASAEEDDAAPSRHKLTTSTSIPTPPSDRNHDGSPSPPNSQEYYEKLDSLFTCPIDNNPVLPPILQHKLLYSATTTQGPHPDCNVIEDAAEALFSLRFPRVEAEESAHPLSKKYCLSTFQAQVSAAGRRLDTAGRYCPSPPYSSTYYDTPSPVRAQSSDSNETEVLVGTSDSAATDPINEHHPPAHSQLYIQEEPSTRRSMRIHIKQEARNLESNMNRNSTSPQRQLKSKEDAAWEAGVWQAARDLEIQAGGPPKSESKEHQQQYERNYVNAWARRECQKPWTQLEQAERFVKNMSKDTFEYARTNRESEEPGQPIINSHPNRDAPRPRRKIRPKPATQNLTSKPRPAKKIAQRKRASTVPLLETLEEGEAKAETKPCDPNPSPEAAWPQQASPPPRKKRRSVTDNLVSALGRKWEAHVDEHGHRPSRNATRKG